MGLAVVVAAVQLSIQRRTKQQHSENSAVHFGIKAVQSILESKLCRRFLESNLCGPFWSQNCTVHCGVTAVEPILESKLWSPSYNQNCASILEAKLCSPCWNQNCAVHFVCQSCADHFGVKTMQCILESKLCTPVWSPNRF